MKDVELQIRTVAAILIWFVAALLIAHFKHDVKVRMDIADIHCDDDNSSSNLFHT
jgi:hypothetical protein